ncbi:hypothetical protein ACFL3U_03075 [Pseudomonadota bacterium]
MSFVSRITLVFLVVLCAAGTSLPVMAALRDYGIYLSSIGGSTLLRLDNKLKENRGQKTEENELTSTTELRTKGFVWDPRFMTVDLNFKYSTSQTKADTFDSEDDTIGFNFKSVLFPRWRYPFLPIRLSASKTTRTIENDGRGGNETDYTRMTLNWGVAQKQLGRVRMRYAYTLEESTGDSREQDTVKNRLLLNSNRTLLKGKWGETRLSYGYHFDSSDDRIEDQSSLQHNLFTHNTTKFGKKAKSNSNVLFYQRYYEGRGDGLTDDRLFSSNVDLKVQQTERFRHNYSLGLRSDNDSNSYNGTANANYTYVHEFDEYLKGTASTGGTVRYLGGSNQDSSLQFHGNVRGGVAYLRNYDIYRLNARYSMGVTSPTWGSGTISTGAQTESVRINQSASLKLSRQNNPLYSDTATFQARYLIAEEDSYSYSTGYSATSKYNYSSKVSSLISGNVNASQSSRSDSSIGFGSSAMLRYRFGRSARASLNARQRWRDQGGNEYSLLGVRGMFSGQLYRRFDIKFLTELGWTRKVEEAAEGDKIPEDEINGSIEVNSSIGKLVTSLKYTYREIDDGGNITSDQLIMLQIKRFFGWRL